MTSGAKIKSVLVLSSANPTIGPGTLAADYWKALRQGGYDADLLTLNPVEGHPEFLSLYNRPYSRFHNFRFKLWEKLRKPDPSGEHRLFYRNEKDMPVPFWRFRKAVRKHYDCVLIVFWQEMLTFETVRRLYHFMDRPRFVFACVDFSPASGGCHFIGDCTSYDNGCGNCPMLGGTDPDDFTSANTRFRRRVYDEIKPVLTMNTYMAGYFRRSRALAPDTTIRYGTMLFDMDVFRPMPRGESRSRFGLPDDSSFVIFFGSQSLDEKRKGFDLLLDALAKLRRMLTDADAARIRLLIAGRSIETVKERLPFAYTYTGYVPSADLPWLYSAADVYLSPSVSDAGPSMVNQSLACGTPVVAFEMGTAIDVIKDQDTGVCAPVGDAEAFAKGIERIFRLSVDNRDSYETMRSRCRVFALQAHSYDAFLASFRSALAE